VDTATGDNVVAVYNNLRALNPAAPVIEAASPISVEAPAALHGKRVVVVEDGPTLTHGGMPFGVGWLAARRHGCVIIDPRPHAVGSLRDVYRHFPNLGPVLPAMGYGEAMIADLEQTLNAADADVVLLGTPINASRFLRLNKPTCRVRYELQEIGKPTLEELLRPVFARRN
jgi:predicted GTPase